MELDHDYYLQRWSGLREQIAKYRVVDRSSSGLAYLVAGNTIADKE